MTRLPGRSGSADDGDVNGDVMGRQSVRSAVSHRSAVLLGFPVRSAVWGLLTKEIR